MPRAARVKQAKKAAVRPARAVRPSARQAKKMSVRPTGGAVGGASSAGAFFALNSAQAHPGIVSDISYLQSSLTGLQDQASLVDVQEDINQLDSDLNHALNLLESARDKGYKYQADLEDIAYSAMSRWEEVRADVDAQLNSQTAQAQAFLNPVDSAVQRLNSVISSASASGALGGVQQSVSRAAREISDIERSIEGLYGDIESQASVLNSRLTRIHWALTQQEEASFEFGRDEDLYMAVAARWDQEGKDDPEGILFLTNQRLMFERKEKVATKKVLFVTTAKELVQELLIDKPLSAVKGIKAHSKGVFGNQDFLDVDYDDQKVAYHLNGQDSEKWGRMIKDAQSGKIEEDRATGQSLSFSDLTGEVTQADIMAMQNEINALQDEMMLKGLQEELSSLENQLSGLSRELADLRARGYVVEKSLEADLEVLGVQWDKIKERSTMTLEYQTKMLSEQMGSIQQKMAQLAGMSANLAAARPVFIQLKSAVASAEAQAEAAEETVLDQYDDYADEVETLDAHLEWVDWMLDALETASFQLLATESGVAGVEAVWDRAGMEPENGILFLTDQRLIWEDRVGDFEAKIVVPMTEITDVKQQEDEESGLEELVFTFGSEAPVPSARFELSQPVAETWLQMVGRARSGGYAEDRTVEIDEAELDRIRNAPSQCSNCGAAFTAPVLRGQTEIVCEFCGVPTRI